MCVTEQKKNEKINMGVGRSANRSSADRYPAQRHDNGVQVVLYLRTTRGTKVSVLFCLGDQTELLLGKKSFHTAP